MRCTPKVLPTREASGSRLIRDYSPDASISDHDFFVMVCMLGMYAMQEL